MEKKISKKIKKKVGVNGTKEKKKTTLYDYFRKQTAKGFNMPTVKLVSDGDICTYLKSIKCKF